MIDHRTSHAPDRVPRPLSERLKAETRAEHRRAETHPLMAAMVSGRIDRALYARYLGQMRHVHATLDAALRAGAQRASTRPGVDVALTERSTACGTPRSG